MNDQHYAEILQKLAIDFEEKKQPLGHPFAFIEYGRFFTIDLRPWWKKLIGKKRNAPSLPDEIARIAKIEIPEAREFVRAADNKFCETQRRILAKTMTRARKL